MSASVRLHQESGRYAPYLEIGWLEYVRKTMANDTVMWLSLALGAASCWFAVPSAGYIDFKTLGCLLCLMTASAGFMSAGLFERAAAAMVRAAGDTRRLRGILVFGTFFAAMLITNDVSLIILVPLALTAYRKIGADPLLTVVLQTVAANVGSALLPIGNPQNLYLFSFFHMRLADFVVGVWPVVAAGGALLAALCLFTRRRGIAPLAAKAPTVRLAQAAPFVVVFAAAILAVFNLLDYRLALVPALAMLAYRGRSVAQQVDYALLLTFVGFFIFVGNLSSVPGVADFLRGLMRDGAFPAAAAASQVISNVPAAVLLSHFTPDAPGLLAGVSAGGCGTLIASMASLISYKLYVRRHGGKWRYLALFTAVNVPFLLAMSMAWWLR